MKTAWVAVLILVPTVVLADVFHLGAREAEERALKSSPRLKAFLADEQAADEQAGAQLTGLLPRLSLEGNYQHVGTVPQLSLAALSPMFQNAPPIQFGANSSYSIGPIVRYTLWDTFSTLQSYRGFSALASARTEDRKNGERQLLLSTRSAYIQVQLALEELRLVDDQLALSRAQDADIATRFRAGAASRLDRVTSERAVISYGLLFQQRQSELSSDLRDLLALTGDRVEGDLRHPGPKGAKGAALVLELDPLADGTTIAATMLPPPDESHPQIRSLELQAESAEKQAASQTARVLPTVQVFAKTTLDYPNGPILQQIHQNTFGASLSLPLFFGDPTWRQAAEKRREADSARSRADQARLDLGRDFSKASDVLQSLREQQVLAARDVDRSEEAAKLYYISYKAGKANLLDVQTANDQALQAKFNAARLDAQILSQLAMMKALSGTPPSTNGAQP